MKKHNEVLVSTNGRWSLPDISKRNQWSQFERPRSFNSKGFHPNFFRSLRNHSHNVAKTSKHWNSRENSCEWEGTTLAFDPYQQESKTNEACREESWNFDLERLTGCSECEVTSLNQLKVGVFAHKRLGTCH